MSLQIRQTLKLAQQLVMTPQLQQAIKLLQHNRLELKEAIEAELEINPILEETSGETNDQPETSEPANGDQSQETGEVEFSDSFSKTEDMDWEAYFGEYNSPHSGAAPTEREVREVTNFENIVSAQPDLVDHLTWQLMLTDLSQADKRLGETIIGNIKPNGYLEVDLAELAIQTRAEEDRIIRILKTVQMFDPAGVAARDLKECLLIQADQLGWEDTLAARIIENGLDDLANRNYKALTKRFKVAMDEVADAVEMISSLDPKPGRAFSNEIPHYITPDIQVVKDGDDYRIVVNDDGLPKLKVNPLYRRALASPDSVPPEAKAFIQEKMKAALWLIRSIHQRQRTIYRVTESIVARQRDFLDNGVAHLKPMVLKDVAEDVEMHESTISRVTTNKYVHTPQGVFELKFFFNSAIQRFHGEAMASESVKEHIRRLIAVENQAKPFSDDAIKTALEKENINIARRTVAKYRESMGILSSSKRKRVPFK